MTGSDCGDGTGIGKCCLLSPHFHGYYNNITRHLIVSSSFLTATSCTGGPTLETRQLTRWRRLSAEGQHCARLLSAHGYRRLTSELSAIAFFAPDEMPQGDRVAKVVARGKHTICAEDGEFLSPSLRRWSLTLPLAGLPRVGHFPSSYDVSVPLGRGVYTQRG